MAAFADKVRRARGGRTYADVGRAVGCSPENIRKLEAGVSEPGFKLGIRLADALGVPATWLADDSADWPPPESSEQQALTLVQQALASAGLVGELSDLERRAIAALRALSPEARAETVGYITGLAGSTGSAASPPGGAGELPGAESAGARKLAANIRRRLQAMPKPAAEERPRSAEQSPPQRRAKRA